MENITGLRAIAKVSGSPSKAFDLSTTIAGEILGDYKPTLTYGTDDNQVNAIWGDAGTLAGAATVDIDLQALTDVFADTITLTKLKWMWVHNISDNGARPYAEIAVGGAAANEFVDWVGAAGDQIYLQEGACDLIVAPKAGYTVGAAAKNLRITNLDGAKTAAYEIIVAGLVA